MTEKLVKMLKDAGIVKIKEENEEPYILASGKKSRLFIDIKGASLDQFILREISVNLNDLIEELLDDNEFHFDIVGSVAVGGIPVASVYEYTSRTPQIIVRSEKHETGMKSKVVGDDGKGNLKGKRILLIEDVATTGGSIIKAVKAIRETGAICTDCIVIVDRNEGARRLCKENCIDLHSILKKSDFGISEDIDKANFF